MHALSAEKRRKYERLFDEYVGGGGGNGESSKFLSGSRAKFVLTNLTKLSVSSLANIWEYADEDRDGRLSKSEFVTAMHLAEMAKLGGGAGVIPPAPPRNRGSVAMATTNHPSSAVESAEDRVRREHRGGELLRKEVNELLSSILSEFGFGPVKLSDQSPSMTTTAINSPSVSELNRRLLSSQRKAEETEATIKAIDYEITVIEQKAEAIHAKKQQLIRIQNDVDREISAMKNEMSLLTAPKQETGVEGRKTREKSMEKLKRAIGVNEEKLLRVIGHLMKQKRHRVLGHDLKSMAEQLLLGGGGVAEENEEDGGVDDSPFPAESAFAGTNTLYPDLGSVEDPFVGFKEKETLSDSWAEVNLRSCPTEAQTAPSCATPTQQLESDHQKNVEVPAAAAAASPSFCSRPGRTFRFIALYDYTPAQAAAGQTNNDLSFRRGDVIVVTELDNPLGLDRSWLTGRSNNRIGLFPKCYTEPEHEPTQTTTTTDLGTTSTVPLNKTADLYVALFDFDSSVKGDLAFSKGELITVTDTSGSWWSGSIGPRHGVFPYNYVQLASSSKRPLPAK